MTSKDQQPESELKESEKREREKQESEKRESEKREREKQDSATAQLKMLKQLLSYYRSQKKYYEPQRKRKSPNIELTHRNMQITAKQLRALNLKVLTTDWAQQYSRDLDLRRVGKENALETHLAIRDFLFSDPASMTQFLFDLDTKANNPATTLSMLRVKEQIDFESSRLLVDKFQRLHQTCENQNAKQGYELLIAHTQRLPFHSRAWRELVEFGKVSDETRRARFAGLTNTLNPDNKRQIDDIFRQLDQNLKIQIDTYIPKQAFPEPALPKKDNTSILPPI